MTLSKAVYIVAARRTAFGAFGGKIKELSTTKLGEIASISALKQINLNPTIVDSVVFGNVLQTSADGAYLARHVGLGSNIPVETRALTVNHLCGSGLQAIVTAAKEIVLNEADIVLAGGSENMSQAPFAVRNARFGIPLGQSVQLSDTIHEVFTDYFANISIGMTAENVGEKYGITRLQSDEYALQSQQRWLNAQKNGHFKDEIAPIEIKKRKGVEVFEVDEHPHSSSTLEELQKLPPAFKENGTVTAGNSCGVCDGAVSLILASEEACTKQDLKPLAKIVSYGVSGVEPSIMGIGPCSAMEKALRHAQLSFTDMALIEVNETFACQYLACEKILGLDRSITNTSGGAISLGHPLSASGARLVAHLTYALRRRNEKYAIASVCIGGGQGIAVVLENMFS